MCGITGYLVKEGSPPDRSVLVEMCNRLVHRGPDASGYYCDPSIALGHRRLSIIDLARGHQPMGNEDGSIQVVFNGEIYDFEHFRRELIERGHRLTTQSDTEVLVHLYEELGEQLPEVLHGMFALAIWDARRRHLFLARDRMGKKPLYYSFAVPGVKFCFASELQALTALPFFDPSVSDCSVANFLALSYIPDPDTIYKGVYKLKPGHSLLVTPAGARMRRYWEPAFSAERPLAFDAAVEQLRTLAVDAVKRRMVSDVPLGVFLSGGLDSSAVTAIVSTETPSRPKTFSIGFTDEKFDERRFARLLASRYGTEHYEEVVSSSIHETLQTLANHFSEPFGDASAIPTLHLARVTRRQVTVALGGDGADELFGGYRRYYYGVLEEKLRARWPAWFRQTFVRLGGKYYPKLDYLPKVFRAKTFLTNLAQEIGDAYFTSMSVFRDSELQAVLSPDVRRGAGDYCPRVSFRGRFEAFRHLPPLEQMQAVDLQTYLPGDILVKLDRATMAYSLEARSPWLDHRLVELSCRLPTVFKLNGTKGKYVFKQAMATYVPPEVAHRRKMGFSVPLANWFRTSLAPAFRDLVLRSDMESYLSLGEVERLWQEHQSGLSNHDRKLWNLLMLACWDVQHRSNRERKPMVARADAKYGPISNC